jgi:hypothetical protein
MDMGIIVDINKAKEITKSRLRAERTPLLEAQDVAFQRALENSSDTSAIVAEKQRLRDITNQVDTATTLDELLTLNCDKPVAEVTEQHVVESTIEGVENGID